MITLGHYGELSSVDRALSIGQGEGLGSFSLEGGRLLDLIYIETPEARGTPPPATAM